MSNADDPLCRAQAGRPLRRGRRRSPSDGRTLRRHVGRANKVLTAVRRMLACMTLSRLEADPLQDLQRDINDHFKAVGQRFAGVDRRFDQLEARLDGFGRRPDVVVQRLNGVDRRLQRLKKFVGFVARQHGWTEPPP